MPNLRLEEVGSTRATVAVDDNPAGSPGPHVVYTAARTAVYRVLVTSPVPATGNYMLTVRQQ